LPNEEAEELKRILLMEPKCGEAAARLSRLLRSGKALKNP
jgi:hypothetical protein